MSGACSPGVPVGGGGGGPLHTKCTQICVLRTEKYTHFGGHFFVQKHTHYEGIFFHKYPILKDNCFGIITKDRNAELNSLGYRLL